MNYRTNIFFCLALILSPLCLFPFAGATVSAGDVHVDPRAEAGGDGRLGSPFDSIQDALDSIDELSLRERTESVRILLHGGTYFIPHTLKIKWNRPGGDANDTRLFITGWNEESPRLVGGVAGRSRDLHPVADRSVLARLPTAEARSAVRMLDLARISANQGSLSKLSGPVHRGMGLPTVAAGSEVFWDGRALTRSRWPNEGFVVIKKVVDGGSIPRNRGADIPPVERETGPARGGVFEFPGDGARLTRWANAKNAWAFGYWHWDWADEQLPIASIDQTTREIRLGMPHRYGLRNGGKFYVTNLLEELDMPGEYFIDTESKTLYVWSPDDDGDATVEHEILISLNDEPLLEIAAGSRNVTITGIGFDTARGGVISARKVEGVQIIDCDIRNTGTNGVVVDGRDNAIRGNSFSGIGATALSVSGGDRATLTPAGNEIVDNTMTDFGRVYRTYQPAIRLSGVGQHIAHNLIHDAPHSGIIFNGNDHVIEFNEIYDVLRETGDCGAIYCGRDWTLHGTVIRNNFFHDLTGTDGRYQNAVYLDDMASGITVAGNIFYNCHWGMLVGGGRDNLIMGNVFIGGTRAISFDARGVGWMAKNIADPSTSTLHKNLAAVPYDQPPWSERFATLQTYLTDRFGRPAGSAFVGNAIYNTKLGWIEDKESVRVEGNVEMTVDVSGLFLERRAAGEESGGRPHRFYFRKNVWLVDAIEGFVPIALQEFGPPTLVGRN